MLLRAQRDAFCLRVSPSSLVRDSRAKFTRLPLTQGERARRVRTTASRNEMKFTQMYHAKAFSGIFPEFQRDNGHCRLDVYASRGGSDSSIAPAHCPFIAILERRSLALRGPLPQGTIIKVQTPSIKAEPSRTVEEVR